MCGVPYGTVDVDRLLATLTLVETAPGRFEVGVQEKGVSALESLLFAKYQMYRNVYWHHAVRSATCMFKRAVRGRGAPRQPSTVEAIAEATDDGLMELLITRDGNALAAAIRAAPAVQARARPAGQRRVPAMRSPGSRDDPDLLERVEDALAAAGRAGARRAAARFSRALLDARRGPAAPDPRRDRSSDSTDAGRAGQLGLPRVADELYRSARRLRVFVASTAAPSRSPAFSTCLRFPPRRSPSAWPSRSHWSEEHHR